MTRVGPQRHKKKKELLNRLQGILPLQLSSVHQLLLLEFRPLPQFAAKSVSTRRSQLLQLILNSVLLYFTDLRAMPERFSPAYYSQYYLLLGSFSGVKRPGRGVDHPPHLAPRLKKEQSYTSTPPLGRRGLFEGELYITLLYFTSVVG